MLGLPMADIVWGELADIVWSELADIVWGELADIVWSELADIVWGELAFRASSLERVSINLFQGTIHLLEYCKCTIIA